MEQQMKSRKHIPIQYQEYIALCILSLTTFYVFTSIWRKWGNWTLSFAEVALELICLQFISFSSRVSAKTPRDRRKKQIIIFLVLVLSVSVCGWLYHDTMVLSEIWTMITLTVCFGIMPFLPSPNVATPEERIRLELRDLAVTLAVVLVATAILLFVLHPITIRQGQHLAEETAGESVTYITSLTTENVGFLRYNEDATKWEWSTGCYLYITRESGKEVIVYFATRRVVVPSEGGHSND